MLRLSRDQLRPQQSKNLFRRWPVKDLPLEVHRALTYGIMVEILEPTKVCVIPISAASKKQMDIVDLFTVPDEILYPTILKALTWLRLPR